MLISYLLWFLEGQNEANSINFVFLAPIVAPWNALNPFSATALPPGGVTTYLNLSSFSINPLRYATD